VARFDALLVTVDKSNGLPSSGSTTVPSRWQCLIPTLLQVLSEVKPGVVREITE
jgi:hypothetical protein